MKRAIRRPHLYAGAVVVLIVVWAFVTGGGAILHGHPTYWIAYGLALIAGITAVVVAFAWSRRPLRPVWSMVGTVILLVVGGLMWWLRPYIATEVALDALRSDETVAVDSGLTEITMTPTGDRTGVGLIFLPGARVDARAYAHVLRPIAEAGHPVVIVKEPLGVAFFATDAAPGWAAGHPQTPTWVVAGHSLGGVVAAQNAAEPNEIRDLVLWASFPADDVSARPFSAVSVFGTQDALTTPEKIEESRSDLPRDSRFTAIEGANHSSFGDYGDQPGDGEATTPRNRAQAEIVAVTLDFLDR